MATDTAVLHDNKVDWSGGEKKPFKASYGKLMMWYFLLSDAFTFSGFLIAYGTLRISMPSWPVPDEVFQTLPFWGTGYPLYFVTFMTFVLLFSSYTMVRAVQEGARENKNGVVVWMFLTIIGGLGFLGCQAWEWTELIGHENMSVTRNTFGTHTQNGFYLDANGNVDKSDPVVSGKTYLIHKADFASSHGHAHDDHGAHDDGHGADAHGHGHSYEKPGHYKDAFVDDNGFIHRKFQVTEGDMAGKDIIVDGVSSKPYEMFGPKAFGALFFFITGFHGTHVLSGVIFLIVIMLNVMTGMYIKRKNGYEMVEKIGLYWHFVDLVWVFVFLVFYLI